MSAWHDAGRQSLRRAARVALVGPAVFAFLLNVVGSQEAALFGAFGAFACLGFADFGGEPAPRARAYAVLTATGAVLVTAGTVLSRDAWAAAVVMVVVAFSVRFVGFFGGYWNAAVSPAILAYVLGATVPGAPGTIPARVGGWVLAGAAATLAALVLWPRRERRVIRVAAGRACRALATAVDGLALADGPSDAERVAATDAVEVLVRAASTPQRAAGPAAHDVALSFLVDQTQRVATLVGTRPTFADARGGKPPPHPATARFAAETLRVAGRALVDGDLVPDPDALSARREALREEVIVDLGARLGAGGAGGDILEELDGTFVARAIAYVAVSIAANAAILVSGHGPRARASSLPIEAPVVGDERERLRQMVRANVVAGSPWLQDSVRAGVALGVAVLVAGLSGAQHAFWIALGTLAVLRSNAFATGRSALEAALGTGLGFAISAALLAVIGLDRSALWLVTVAGFFLAAYLPGVVGFVAGQAAFTIFVVALFNLIVPEGWRTGLVRVEDIVIGVVVSVVVSLCLWPSGAARQLARSTVALYRALADALSSAPSNPPRDAPPGARPEGPGPPSDVPPSDLLAEEQRAHAAYAQLVAETDHDPARRRSWATLLGIAAADRAGVAIVAHQRAVACAEAGAPTPTVIDDAAEEVARAWARLADAVERGPEESSPSPDWEALSDRTRAPVVAGLEAGARHGSVESAVAVAFAREWLVQLARLVGPSHDAVRELRRAEPGSTRRGATAALPRPR